MRDRIAASAREKLSQVDKEKQLQAERKRKAAMFINLLKSNNTEAGATEANEVAMGRWTYVKICKYSKTCLKLPLKKDETKIFITGPRSAVGNVSGYRCVSDCRSRGHEFDPSLVPYFRRD